MRLPRVRFTVRTLMVAVAITGFVFAGEARLYRAAASSVRGRPGGASMQFETVFVWVVLNAVLLFAACLLCRTLLGGPSDPSEPE